MNKILHTYFFGYLSYRYRRLIRSLSIILLVFTIIIVLINIYQLHNDKQINFIYERYVSTEYASQDFYTTSIGNERTKSYLVNKYGDEGFQNQIDNGILTKMQSCIRPDKEFTKNEFINSLPTNNALGCIAFAIGKQENMEGINNYRNADDFILKGLKIRYFNTPFPLVLSIFIYCILICVISYLIEPFILEKRNKVDDLGSIKNSESAYNEPKNFFKNIIIKNDNVKFAQARFDEKGPKKKSRFDNYFTFNNEYLSGTNFWIRMFVGWLTLVIFGLGFYIMLTTTYKRAQSLGLSKVLAITSCIYIPIMNILTFLLIRTDDSEVNLLKAVILGIPFAYFYFKNGKKK
jgi:hypothetical protein